MNRPRHFKQITYVLIFILLSANQAVLASSVLFVGQEHESRETSMMVLVNEDHHVVDHNHSADQNTSLPDGNHDHQTHSDCDGSDNCNHCVNLLNSAAVESEHQFSELAPGIFPAFSDTFLPADIRPPKYL